MLLLEKNFLFGDKNVCPTHLPGADLVHRKIILTNRNLLQSQLGHIQKEYLPTLNNRLSSYSFRGENNTKNISQMYKRENITFQTTFSETYLLRTLEQKRWFYVHDGQEDRTDLILGSKKFVHEGFSAFKGEPNEQDRAIQKKILKTSNFSGSSNSKPTKPTLNEQCPLADGTHCTWNVPYSRKMNKVDRYVSLRTQKCLGKKQIA